MHSRPDKMCFMSFEGLVDACVSTELSCPLNQLCFPPICYPIRGVVYLDQRLDALHWNAGQNLLFQHFKCLKLKKEVISFNICCKNLHWIKIIPFGEPLLPQVFFVKVVSLSFSHICSFLYN